MNKSIKSFLKLNERIFNYLYKYFEEINIDYPNFYLKLTNINIFLNQTKKIEGYFHDFTRTTIQ